MNLRDYQWSQNPRGLQNKGPFRSVDPQRYTRPQMGWAALVAGGDEYVDEAAELVESGVTPIVRIHRSRPGAMAVPDDWYEAYQAYFDAGVRWFELFSEPNTEDFWPPDLGRVSWENAECIEPLMDNWLGWAERIVAMGGYPAFPALAPSGDRATATVYWLDAFIRYLGTAHGDRFLRVLGSGLWVATHADVGNRFYQEPPGGPAHVARPYYQQSADEPGWHFEYPYDPIMQRQDPGRTVFGGGSGAARFGDTLGLVAAGEGFNQLLKHHMDLGPLPVVATAGGISPVPAAGEEAVQQDDRYPPYNRESHAEAVLAMWRWIAHQGPPWFFGLCLTNEAAYYEEHGVAAAIQRMDDEPPARKQVPDIDPGGLFDEPEAAEEEIVVEGSATVVEDERPEWVAEGERRAAMQAEAANAARRDEGPPEPGGERPERGRGSGLDDDAEEMILDAAEGVDARPDAYEEGEIPDWLAEELPPEELQELMGEGSWEPEEESLEELVAIDSPEEPSEYDEMGMAERAAGVGRPESEVDPDYDDLTGQVVDAWEEPDEEGSVPDIRLDDLPPDAQEELAAITGAQMPEELAYVTEEDDWEEDGGDQPEELTSDLEETEDLLLGFLGGEPVPPDVEEAERSGELAPDADRGSGLTRAVFEAGELLDEDEAGEAGFGQREETRPTGRAEGDTGPLIDMTGEWSDEDISGQRLGMFDLSRSAEPAPLDGEMAAQAAREPTPIEITHHWLVFAPGTDPTWFFEAGWRYWQEFRPTVVGDWQQIALVPAGRSIALTVLVPGDQAEEFEARVHVFRPDAIVDVIEADSLEDVRSELGWRVSRGRRLG
ncbi:MAG TPA: hypothetical protein VKY39_00150 [Aggregatilineales bacterium]|nr:hypothetical protein [Aggregatilineales bacterium]